MNEIILELDDKKTKFDSNHYDLNPFLKEIKDSNFKINDLIIDKEDYLNTIVIKTSQIDPDERMKLIDDTFEKFRIYAKKIGRSDLIDNYFVDLTIED